MTTPNPGPNPKDQARHSIIVAGAVAAVAIIAVLVVVFWPKLTGGSSGSGYSPSATQPPNANATASGIVANPKASANHILAIYQDYQCPVCASVHKTMASVIAKAVNSNTIRVEYRTMTFLDRLNSNATGAAAETAQSSTRAANAAACADAVGHFFAYNEYLFNNQPSEGTGYTEQFLRQDVPAAVGITGNDLTTFQQCYDSKQFNSFVSGVYQAASQAGISGTPTYMIDGVALSLTTADALQSDIDAALAGHGPTAPPATPTSTSTPCVPQDPPTANPGPMPPNANAKGTGIVANPQAPDTHVLAIYTDFQCPYCAKAEQTVGPVVAQAVAANKLRVEFHTMTFLDQANKSDDTAKSSTRAANAAACADLGGFYFKYQEYIMLHQPSEGTGYTDDFLVNQVPAALGIGGQPLTAFQQCYSAQQFSAFVNYVAQAPYYACVTGTPTYLLDGQQVSTTSADDLQKAITAAVG